MATRRERVVLELEDQFTSRMARAAAITAVLNKELGSLSRESVKTQRSFSDIDRSAGSLGRNADRAGSQIDRLSGRLRVLTDVATLLAPAGIAIGAVAVPAVTALAAQLGFAAGAAGVTVLAFQGVGDTLKALDKAALEPTRENLEAANLAMLKLSPAAREFAQEIRDLIPEATRLRDVAATGLFPGVVEGLNQLEGALPRVEQIVAAVSTELGHIAADTGTSLASDRWAPFLDFIAQEAPSALADMASAAGNTAHAVAELFMAADPLNDNFSQWLVDATADLDRWAAGLSQTQGFHEFIDFVSENGPRVADTFGAIANAVIQVVEAASPLSGPVLQGIEALADAVSAIADSDVGTPLFTAAAALALFNRTMGVAVASRNGITGFQGRLDTAGARTRSFGANVRTTTTDLRVLSSTALTAGARTERELLRMSSASARLKANLAPVGRGAAGVAALTIASTGAADSLGLANTASLALLGTMIAPGWGTAIGATAGLLLDAAHASSAFSESLDRADAAIQSTDIEKLTASLDELTRKQKAAQDAISAPAPPRGQSRAFLEADALGRKADEVREKLDFEQTAERGKADLDFLAQGFDATSSGLDTATQSAEDFKTSLDKINDVMSGRATFRGYEQALIDFADRAKKRAEIQAKIVAAEADLAAAKSNDPALQHRIEEARTRVSTAKTPLDRKNAQGDLQALLDQTSASQSEAAQRAQENIASLREELGRYKNTLDTTTQAGIDTQASIDAIANSAIQWAKTIKDPVLRTAFLDNARKQYIKATIDAGASEKAAQDLATQIGLLDGVTGRVIITVDASGGVQVISELQRRLIRLQRLLAPVQRAKNLEELADRRDFATGGWTGPGLKYQPAGVVHADEFVFSKEATNGNVAFLNDLHRQLRGYADGGLVRRMPMPPASMTVSGGGLVRFSDGDIDRIAGALAAVRPIYGDAHFHGDAAKREQDRLSSLDGVRRR